MTLTNAGSALLNLTGIAITGSNSTNFGFLVKGTSPCPLPSGTLIAGASCTISVDFAPQAPGPVSATLSILEHLYRAAGDGEPFFRGASSDRLDRGYRDELSDAVWKGTGRSAV